MTRRSLVTLAAVAFALPLGGANLLAQASVGTETRVLSTTPVVAPRAAEQVGPTFEAGRATFSTISLSARPDTAALKVDDQHLGAGENLALMGVGAAGLIVGLIVGGKGGTGIAIGGALVGLYGLYRYLK